MNLIPMDCSSHDPSNGISRVLNFRTVPVLSPVIDPHFADSECTSVTLSIHSSTSSNALTHACTTGLVYSLVTLLSLREPLYTKISRRARRIFYKLDIWRPPTIIISQQVNELVHTIPLTQQKPSESIRLSYHNISLYKNTSSESVLTNVHNVDSHNSIEAVISTPSQSWVNSCMQGYTSPSAVHSNNSTSQLTKECDVIPPISNESPLSITKRSGMPIPVLLTRRRRMNRHVNMCAAISSPSHVVLL